LTQKNRARTKSLKMLHIFLRYLPLGWEYCCLNSLLDKFWQSVRCRTKQDKPANFSIKAWQQIHANVERRASKKCQNLLWRLRVKINWRMFWAINQLWTYYHQSRRQSFSWTTLGGFDKKFKNFYWLWN
jgi:hypothetical protein